MKSKRQPFQEGGTFVARKTFRFHGRTFARGAEFPWRQMSCSARKLYQLFDNGFLIPAGSMEQPVEVQPAPNDSAEAKAERRREAGRKAAEARKRNAEAKAQTIEAPAEE